MPRSKMTKEQEAQFHLGLRDALKQGWDLLARGATALEAVEASIKCLQDNPIFNAGRGSVFTHDGQNEMDASIMCGKTLSAGAVTGISKIQNPISLALKVMTSSQHVFLCGEGAQKFAQKFDDIQQQKPQYFYTELQWQNLQIAQQHDSFLLDEVEVKQTKIGTVGAVALDQFGNLAAGTSTGGMSNQQYGRIGDSPVIGAGTYANNHTCAVSSTGHGQFIIKSVLAYDIHALIKYTNRSLKQAADLALSNFSSIGGIGGIISVDSQGKLYTPFFSQGMYRAYATSQQPEKFTSAIYPGDERDNQFEN